MKHDNRDSREFQTGHRVALKFSEGWWMFNVIGTEYNELKPVTLLNENDNRDVIGAQTSGSDNDQIRDPTGDRLLVPADDERNLVYHVMYGINPSRMQVFEQWGRDRNRAIEDYDAPGEPAPIVNGFDSPYNNPTKEAEFVTVNNLNPPKLQAYNPTDTALEANLSFHVTKLRYAVIDDMDVKKAIMQGQMNADKYMMGGGVQDSNQVRPPQWLTENFGDTIHTTRQILEHNVQPPEASEAGSGTGGSGNGENGGIGSGVPDRVGEIGNNGGDNQ